MPKAPPKPCIQPRCKQYATERGYCDDHQKERKAKQWDHGGKNRHQRGYGSKWDKLRKVVLSRDKHMCQECLRAGIYKQGNQVDHIKPKAEGGDDNTDNLQVLCYTHHQEKTVKEAANAR